MPPLGSLTYMRSVLGSSSSRGTCGSWFSGSKRLLPQRLRCSGFALRKSSPASRTKSYKLIQAHWHAIIRYPEPDMGLNSHRFCRHSLRSIPSRCLSCHQEPAKEYHIRFPDPQWCQYCLVVPLIFRIIFLHLYFDSDFERLAANH